MSDIKNSNDRLQEDLNHYRRAICYMEANAPIQALCLPKSIENILLADGCLRIYDLLNRNLREIKGLGDSRIRHLTARLDEFISISI